jgi:hypothetical protein
LFGELSSFGDGLYAIAEQEHPGSEFVAEFDQVRGTFSSQNVDNFDDLE